MLKAIAIDDEPLPLELLQEFCSQTDFITLEKTFTNIGQAQKYLRKFPIDLLFLDIQMPKISGIELCKSLKQEVMVIFTTAHSQYAIDGFNLNAIDYLLKPFSFSRFEQAIGKAYQLHNMMHNRITDDRSKYLMLKSANGLVKVMLSDILFVEGFDNYVKINLCNGTSMLFRMTLKILMEKLHTKEFLRVHRSYIISISKVGTVKHKTITMSGGKEVPIGKNYEDTIKKTFKIDL